MRATGFNFGYGLSQLAFAAFAPNISNAVWVALAQGTPAGSHALLIDASPAVWTYVGLLSAAAGLVGVWYAVRIGAVARLSTRGGHEG